jgi:hypothetical protein
MSTRDDNGDRRLIAATGDDRDEARKNGHAGNVSDGLLIFSLYVFPFGHH